MSEQFPADTLAVTLIEIVLQGHEFVHLTRGPITGWTCRSYKAQPSCPDYGHPEELWDAWRVAVEDGTTCNVDPVAPAVARLAEIRERRAIRAAVEAQAASDAEAMLEGTETEPSPYAGAGYENDASGPSALAREDMRRTAAASDDPSEDEGLVWDRNEYRDVAREGAAREQAASEGEG